MILTGKAKEDFEKWNNDIYGTVDTAHSNECIEFKHLNPELQHSVIVDWFDSIGIYISIINKFDDGIYFIYSIYNSKKSIKLLSKELEHYLNRNAAKKNAIIKANEIYNETNKTTTL